MINVAFKDFETYARALEWCAKNINTAYWAGSMFEYILTFDNPKDAVIVSLRFP